MRVCLNISSTAGGIGASNAALFNKAAIHPATYALRLRGGGGFLACGFVKEGREKSEYSIVAMAKKLEKIVE